MAGARERNKDADPTEEVVGQLDNAIGSSGTKGSGDTGKKSILDSMDYEDQEDPQLGGGGRGALLEGAFYDSDSSKEEEENKRKRRKNGR